MEMHRSHAQIGGDAPPTTKLSKLSHRQSLGNTASTSSCASWSDESASSIGESFGAAKSASADLLVKMIAKEMMANMMQGQLEAHEISKEENDELVTDFESLAKMIMKNTDITSHQRPDELLRQMLRESFEELPLEDDDEDDEEVEAAKSVSDTGSRTISSSSAGTTSSSDFSGLSMDNVAGEEKPKRKKKKKSKASDDAPMDIWHPDFWGDSTLDDDLEAESKGFTTESSRETFSRTDVSASDVSEGKSISEFVKTLETVNSDSDSDESSVVSDISGLTGVFEDFAFDRETRARPEKKKPGRALPKATQAPTIIKEKSKKKDKKVAFNVTFKDVIIREYSIVLTDNPACQSGIAIGLGWQYNKLNSISVDDWEYERKTPRKGSQLIMDRARREKMAKRWGYTEKEIAAAVRMLNKLRTQRRATVNNLGASKMEEAAEAAREKMKRLLFLKKKTIKTQY